MYRPLLILIALVLACGARAQVNADLGPYDLGFLDGNYRAHDIYALVDNAGVSTGARQFSGAGALQAAVSYPGTYFGTYAVAADGRMGFAPLTQPLTRNGAIGQGGLWAVNADAGDDALLVSVGVGVSIPSFYFLGDYAYHALLCENDGTWRNIVGGAQPDGVNVVRLIRPQGVVDLDFRVKSNGQVELGDQPQDAATLAGSGEFLVHTLNANKDDDPLFPDGYRGLAFYVRRGEATATDFSGTYRVMQLVVTSDGPSTASGTVTAGGDGIYFGALGGADISGQFTFNADGTFTKSDDTKLLGILGAGGDLAIVSRTNGLAPGGVNRAGLQVWVRTAGGGALDGDSDGDGVRNSAETGLGTSSTDRDTDDDGLLDNNDARPTTADNVYTAVLSETSIEVNEGDTTADTVELSLDSNDFPFFDWSLTPEKSWIEVTPDAGSGDATATITVDPTGFTAVESPYRSKIQVTAPHMRASTAPVLTVNVTATTPLLALEPSQLQFTGVAGQPFAARNVTLTGPADETYAWTAETNAAWLTIAPESGTGDATLSITPEITALDTTVETYTAEVTFAITGDTHPPAVLTVQVTFLTDRDIGEAFPVGPGLSTQSSPCIAAAGGHGIIAWREGNLVLASILGPGAAPVVERRALSLAVLGAAQNPAAAAVDGTAWVVWKQHLASSGSMTLQGRQVNLASGTPKDIFGVAGGDDDLGGPCVAPAAPEDLVGVAYFAENSGAAQVVLTAFDTTTQARAYETRLGGNLAAIDSVALGYDPLHGEWLVAWAYTDANAEQGLAARRVNASTGAAIVTEMPLGESLTAPTVDAVHWNAIAGVWEVLWHEAGDSLTLTRFAGGSSTSTREHLPVAANVVSADAVTATGPQQSVVTFATDADSGALQVQRYTARGRVLGAPSALPDPGALESKPRMAYADTAEELWLAWEDSRLGRMQIYAMRLEAGAADEDKDGLPNDWELDNNLDPLSAEGDDGAMGDPDQDGLTNVDEYAMGTDPQEADTDGDGLWDRQEDRDRDGVVDAGESSPLLTDTDQDGFNDDTEYFGNSDANDAGDTPTGGIVRVAYDAVVPGQPLTLRVHMATVVEGAYTLALNGGWNPPDGWQAVPRTGNPRVFGMGSNVWEIDVTPPASPTPANSHGSFVFHVSGPGGVSRITVVLVADGRVTSDDATELAARFAPIVRLHRSEDFVPTTVETTLEQSAFALNNTRTLQVAPELLDVYQAPQREARIDVNGETIAALRNGFPTDAPVAVYYTVASLDGPSGEPDVPTGHTVIQYWCHFTADAWGAGVSGGSIHEGDWELFQVLLNGIGEPYRATATQQVRLAQDEDIPGGASLPWNQVERVGERPVVYVGSGGHSLYFDSGATTYAPGFEVHDGLGTWLTSDAGATGDYPDAVALSLEPLGRLRESDAALFLRFAGNFGQDAFPQEAGDTATPATDDGTPGPAFLGTPAVASLWTDPYAWAVATPDMEVSTTTVAGTVPVSLAEHTVVLADARGRVYRGSIDTTGAFSVTVPAGVYTLSVVFTGDDRRETFVASARFGRSLIFPTLPAGETALGAFTLVDDALTGSDVYTRTDADGDGTPDATDADADGDGLQNEFDGDVLGDGFNDTYQAADSDGDGIPRYYDPDESSAATPRDSDGDGFIDVVDLDRDQDGFDNMTEAAALTDPLDFFDTPENRLGDSDGDGDVDAVDLQRQIRIILDGGDVPFWADYDHDGVIDARDLQKTVNRILGLM